MKDQSEPKKKKLPDVEVYCDARDISYWYKVGGRYLKLTSRDLRMHLRLDHGLQDNQWFFAGGDGNKPFRETEWPMVNAQKNWLIDYAGPLAGHRVGMFGLGGRKFLVTEEPPELWADLPKKTQKPKLFLSFIHELLAEQNQADYFLYWLHFAIKSIRNGDFRPGQCCVFAGDSGCGKSLLQSLVTLILGGRSANPFRYMMDQTQFNADLAYGEHWIIEDPASTTDIKTRRLFGNKLKECLVNPLLSIHQKGKDALPLPVFRRVTISVNKEPENLAVIPPMDDSIKDKIFLFLCNKVEATFEPFLDATSGEPDRKKLMASFAAEIPAVRAFVLNQLPKLSPALRDKRYGIAAWWHPELMAELEGLSPESRLLALMDDALFADLTPNDVPFFEGKSIEVERKIRATELRFEAEKILRYPGACGTYLGRLAKSHPDRVEKKIVHGYTLWRIRKPPLDKEDRNQLSLGVKPFAVDAGIVKPAF